MQKITPLLRFDNNLLQMTRLDIATRQAAYDGKSSK